MLCGFHTALQCLLSHDGDRQWDEADNAPSVRPQTLTLTEALPDDYDDDDGDDVVPVVAFRPERQINQTIDTSFDCVMFVGFEDF